MLKRQEKERKALFERVFETEDGKRVLEDLCVRNFIFSPCIVPGDPYYTHYNDGRRSVIADLLSYLNISTSELERMERESYERRSNEYDNEY
jgi:hypothetical protein